MRKALFIIDPQKDFVDDPKFMGSLAVTGAKEDMERLARTLDEEDYVEVVVTMDSHTRDQIFHAMWWVDENGNPPDPFTEIKVEDVESGKWRARDPREAEWSLEYVRKLKGQGNFDLRIWPYHCIEGTEGHEIEDVLREALARWEARTGKKVTYVEKGMNPHTEMFSGLKAEVKVPNDPKTELNQEVIDHLYEFDEVDLAGEALSHCLAASGRDLMKGFEKKEKGSASKVSVLRDCTSNVSGFEAAGDEFLAYARSLGCKIKNAITPISSKMRIG